MNPAISSRAERVTTCKRTVSGDIEQLRSFKMASIRQQVWNGKIPIKVTVGEPESIGPQEYLLVASRVSYLLLYLDKVLAYFNRYLDHSKEGEWWFEYEGLVVSFNQPIGLLHDLLVGLPRTEPWHLELRRGEFPYARILKFDSEHSLQSYWTNQFKESCYVRDGNAKAVMLLPREKHESLWWAIKHAGDIGEQLNPDNSSFNLFWKNCPTLFNKRGETQNVPIRFHIAPATDADPINTTQNIVELDSTMGQALSLAAKDAYIPILHGIPIHRDVALEALYQDCMYPDGFLHIALQSAEFFPNSR